MTDNLLFEHFTTLATAPDGIPRLRELILQLAVQGKLGTQDPGDEPAGKLLERIRKEREQSVKKGLISKSRTLPKIESDEIPYQIPENWNWLRLNDIGHDCGQKVPDKIFTYIDVTAINKEKGLISDEVSILHPNEAPSRARKIVKKGTVIYSTVRPYLLNIAIINKEFNPEPIVSTAFAVVHPFEGISNRYLFYYLRSRPFVEYVESQMTGMAYPAINDQKFHLGLIPVPPTAEQHRIVEKVDRLMALCDELEARQQQERAGCLRLGTASLTALQNSESPEEFGRQWAQVCEAFEVIFDSPENVATLRQTILQLAVLGRLVRQEPGDDPAEKLVERIRREKGRQVKEGKSKKEKPLEPVHEEEVPFMLPNEWVWTRFGDIATIETNIVPPDNFRNLPHVAPDNIEKRTGRLLHYRTVAEDDVQSPNHHFYPGQIVYSKIRPNLSKLTIVDFEGLCSADMYPIYSHIFNQYLKIYMLSLPFYDQAVGDENRLAMPKINQTQLNLIYVAIPPLSEQHRIVAKVDALMALCDALEARLKERAGVQGRFAAAVGKDISH